MSACTGWIAANWAGDLDWAHWMWACDPDCPMDVEMNRPTEPWFHDDTLEPEDFR